MMLSWQQYYLPRPCPKLKYLFFCLSLLLFSSSFCLFLSSKPTISSRDPHLLEPSKANLSSFPEFSKNKNSYFFPPCPKNFTNYLPCHDPSRSRRFYIENRFRRERHCPESPHERIRCLVPKPTGYRPPFPWPTSRDYTWFKNVPFKKLVEFKKTQNWMRLEGGRFVFPGGGTSFPDGVKGYVDVIKGILPLTSGSIRTVLDIGCGVASFGAFLLNYNILTMSIAPRDIHEAQVQLALERGLPAMLGVLSTYELPYPSRSFDTVHCSRCLVNWTSYDGLYLMEVDRVLRPGGYWVLSGPPITLKAKHSIEVRKEKERLEEVCRRLCWEKIAEKHPVAIWRKPTDHLRCVEKRKLEALRLPRFCTSSNSESAWYRELEPCITRLADANDTYGASGAVLKNWPGRLNDAPTKNMKSITIDRFARNNDLWRRRVLYYDSVLHFVGNAKYRNIMDMNAGLGGFAAALVKHPVWVMNVVPFDTKPDTLGIVYDRGLIGTYMNWCEAFSTYPRTYDLIHVNGLFSMYGDKCDMIDILLEMHRILRPQGAVIIRDRADVVIKVKRIVQRIWLNGLIHSDANILIIDCSVV